MASDFDRLRRDFDGRVAEVLAAARAASTNPAEVREVLLAVQADYDRRLQLLEARDVGDDEDAIWEFRHRRLDRFVADELAAYIESVAPRPSVGGVFARAASQARAGAAPAPTAAQSAELHRCKTCGAPRRREALYGNCLFCGHPFFQENE